MSSYNFGVVFVNTEVGALAVTILSMTESSRVFKQGSVQHEGSIDVRSDPCWIANNVFETQARSEYQLQAATHQSDE